MGEAAQQSNAIRVLIIEDDPMVCKTLERMLLQNQRGEFAVTSCGTLGAGLQQAKTNPPDVVLLDLGLPDSQGMVTVERFVAAEPHLPVAVITGLDEDSEAFLAAEKGAQMCLAKGILDKGLLRRSLRYAIALKHATETVLKRSEGEYRALIENLNDVVFEVSVDGAITYMSPVIRHVLGYNPAELVGKPFSSFIYPDDLSELKTSFVDVLEGRLHPSEFRVRKKDGAICWVRTSSRPAKAADGRPTGIQGVLIDITDKKDAEKARAMQEVGRQWQITFDSLNQVMLLLDSDLRIERANRATQAILGLDPKEIIGRFSWEVVLGTAEPPPECPAVRMKQSGRRETAELPVGRRWFNVVADPVHDDTGVLTHAVYCINDVTERKLADEALVERARDLYESLQFQEGILNTSSIGIMTYRASGECVSANEASAVIIGAKVGDLMAQNFHKLPTWKKSGMYEAAFKALNSGTEQRMETHVVTSFGKDIWLDMAFSRFLSGGQRHLLVFLRDITDRKRVEEALRESEVKFRTIAEQMRDGVFSTDLKGIVTYASPNSMRLFGYTPDEMEGHAFKDFLVETEIPKAMTAFTTSIFGGPSEENLTLMMRRKDRSVFFGELASTLRKADNMSGTIVLIRDITERQLANDALQESEAKYHAVFENAQNIVFILDAVRDEHDKIVDWRYRDVNKMGFAATGLSRKQFVGKTAGMLFPERFAAMHEMWCQTLDMNKVLMYDSSVGKREFYFTMSRLGKDALLGVGVDVTDRKQAEASIREFSGRLLSVQEEEKRRLSAGLHHDVGSMTVGVSARLQAVEEELRVRDTKKALKALKECRGVFNTAVKDLKKLAVDLRPPDLDVLGLSAALRQHFAGVMRDTSLRIQFTDVSRRTKLAPDMQTILFRIAQECVNNAVRHAKARQVRVRLTGGKDGVELLIKDNGRGFDPAAVMARPGSRMGLLAVREMATSRGGKFSVQSAPGKGTTVKVEFEKKGSRGQ